MLDCLTYLDCEIKWPSLQSILLSLLSSEDCRLEDRQVVTRAVMGLLGDTRETSRWRGLGQMTDLVWERLNTGHWASIWQGWRQVYSVLALARVKTVARMCLVNLVTSQNLNWSILVRELVRLCDLGLLLGGPVLSGLLERLAQYLTDWLGGREEGPPVKQTKQTPPVSPKSLTWTMNLPTPLVPLSPVSCPSLTTFLTRYKMPGTPSLMTDCMSDWPALSDPRRMWTTDHLVRLAGPRTVPVELGSKYTDGGWTQRLMTVEQFVVQHMEDGAGEVGYLAQHQLLDQVPSLREDIVVPDFCYTGESEEVDVNVWIGPGGTVSPAHTDPKHNVLCQVTGTKFVALFMPDQGPRLYPHETVMLENTSRVDLDTPDLDQFPELAKLEGYSAILRPGDMLYIPPKVWHYVRSLEQSFSVSFWWE